MTAAWACLGQDRPGLVVLTIELENVLHTMTNHHQPTKLWSPYREPLALFLNKYTAEVRASLHVCVPRLACMVCCCVLPMSPVPHGGRYMISSPCLDVAAH